MNILLAADGSEYTSRAAHYLATHFAAFQGGLTLRLLHVHLPIPQGLALVQAQRILGKDAIDDYYKKEAEAALAPAEKILRERNIAFESVYKVGNIAAEICADAVNNQIDLIVMGSHGHGALKNLLMGSVATKVLAAASDIPVLIVR
jgi:nucleotide-binding universal stress UspA family protein